MKAGAIIAIVLVLTILGVVAWAYFSPCTFCEKDKWYDFLCFKDDEWNAADDNCEWAATTPADSTAPADPADPAAPAPANPADPAAPAPANPADPAAPAPANPADPAAPAPANPADPAAPAPADLSNVELKHQFGNQNRIWIDSEICEENNITTESTIKHTSDIVGIEAVVNPHMTGYCFIQLDENISTNPNENTNFVEIIP